MFSIRSSCHAFYENSEADKGHQLSIFDSNNFLKSTFDEAVGHEAYVERIKQLPITWQNVHFTKALDISNADDGSIQMDFEITYRNLGMLLDGAVCQANLAYKSVL